MPFERAHRDEQNRVVGSSMCLAVVEETDGESLPAFKGVTLDLYLLDFTVQETSFLP